MIVEELKSGQSFKGAVAYITHDRDRAESAERVAWIEMRNIRGDDPERAAAQMAFVAMNADTIKLQNGIKAGRKVQQDPVRHFHISWHEADAGKVTKDLAMEAADGLLKAYGLDQHQAVIAFHNDTKNPHIHIVANTYDWATGKAANVYGDHNKASRFAERFAREHGLHIIERREDNNRRRDEGEQVVRDYEPKQHKGEYNDRAKATEPPRDRNAKGKSSEPLPGDRADLWKRQEEEAEAVRSGIKEEAQAAYDERYKAAKALYRKEWAKLFREQEREKKVFENLGAIGRASYYMKRMLSTPG